MPTASGFGSYQAGDSGVSSLNSDEISRTRGLYASEMSSPLALSECKHLE